MLRIARHVVPAFAVWLVLSIGCPAAAASSVNFGDISHKNLKDQGPASTQTKLPLEIGMIANQSGIASAVKSASSPTSAGFGKYLSISSLQSKYGASSSRRNAVTGAFKKYNDKATVDVFHLRVVTTITIGTAQKMFGDRKSTRLNSSHVEISYAVFCLKKKKKKQEERNKRKRLIDSHKNPAKTKTKLLQQ